VADIFDDLIFKEDHRLFRDFVSKGNNPAALTAEAVSVLPGPQQHRSFQRGASNEFRNYPLDVWLGNV
jgi:hypothetical protein